MSEGPTISTDAQSMPGSKPKTSGGRRRYGTVMPATLVLPDSGRIPCVVRDLSATGAKINLSRRHNLPDRIWIVIPR